MRPFSIFFSTLFVLSATAISCNSNGQAQDPASRQPERNPRLTETIASEKTNFRIDTIYSELENPWGLTWLPDGRMLVNERKGEILIFSGDSFTGEKLNGLPMTYVRGQSGLLDIQLHPKYEENG